MVQKKSFRQDLTAFEQASEWHTGKIYQPPFLGREVTSRPSKGPSPDRTIQKGMRVSHDEV